MINLDDLTTILGTRPFVSPQLQNIDRYRGMVDGAEAPPVIEEPEAEEDKAASGDDDDDTEATIGKYRIAV